MRNRDVFIEEGSFPWFCYDLISKTFQLSLQIFKAGRPKEHGSPEDHKLRQRTLGVLNLKSDGKQAAMSAQASDRAAGKVILTPETREVDRVRIGGESGEWGGRVDPIESQAAGL
jgi:hypothetical protein